MAGAKDVSTPLSTSTSLKLFDGTFAFDSTQFRSVIGALQYLSLTSSDICFFVNKLSQFMHNPTITHWAATGQEILMTRHPLQHILHFLVRIPPLRVPRSNVQWQDPQLKLNIYLLPLPLQKLFGFSLSSKNSVDKSPPHQNNTM